MKAEDGLGVTARGRTIRSARPADVGLVAGFVTVVLADLVRYLRADGVPLSDVALIAMRARDVPLDLPLVGVYSRYGWNHPGPWQFWLSRPFQAVFGDAGLYIATWLMGAVVLATILGLLRRLAGPGTALVALVTFAAVVNAAEVPYLADPWNPTIGALPVVLALVAAWAAGEGWRWGPVVAMAAASFAVGGHVGAMAPAAVAVGLALVWGLRRVRAGSFGIAWLVGAAAVGLVAWLPAILDQVAGHGNLGKLADFALSGDGGERYGASRAVGAAVRLLGWSGAWRRGAGQADLSAERTSDLSAVDILVPLALVVLSVLAARWTTNSHRRLLVVAWLGWITALVTFATVARPAFTYLTSWSAPVAALVWAASLGPWVERGMRAVSDRRLATWATVAVALVATMGTALLPIDRARDTGRTELDVTALAAVVDRARGELPVLVCSHDPYLNYYVYPLMNSLEQEGVPVRSADHESSVVGERRVLRSGERTFAITLVREAPGEVATPAAGSTELARADELSPVEREQSDALVAELLEAIRNRPPVSDIDMRAAVVEGGEGLLDAAAEAAPELADDLHSLASLRPGVRVAIVEGCA